MGAFVYPMHFLAESGPIVAKSGAFCGQSVLFSVRILFILYTDDFNLYTDHIFPAAAGRDRRSPPTGRV